MMTRATVGLHVRCTADPESVGAVTSLSGSP
jgi:hypothetical protein